MAKGSNAHYELQNGVGKCSVPMWCGGLPAGFCDKPAYGEPVHCKRGRDAYTGQTFRLDFKYDGYVPGLACEAHGGPPPRHLGDSCIYCGIAHDDVPNGACLRAHMDDHTNG